MTTYNLATPVLIGTLGNQTAVSSLQVTGILWTSTPQLAPLGSGDLSVTLTDPASGYQETVRYQDASVLDLWASLQSPAANTAFGDIVSAAILAKLVADGKLPPGNIVTA